VTGSKGWREKRVCFRSSGSPTGFVKFWRHRYPLFLLWREGRVRLPSLVEIQDAFTGRSIECWNLEDLGADPSNVAALDLAHGWTTWFLLPMRSRANSSREMSGSKPGLFFKTERKRVVFLRAMKRKGLEIWVFGDHRNYPQDRLTLQVLGKACLLAGHQGRVTVLLLGHGVEEMARVYIGYGAGRVLLVDHRQLASYRTDAYASVLCDLIQEHRPDVFLAGASEFGRELAPRIASASEWGFVRIASHWTGTKKTRGW